MNNCEDIKFDISCKMTIEKSFEPVATWVEDNMGIIFCIGQFMSRFKDTLKESGINITNVTYDSNHITGIDYNINDEMLIRVTSMNDLIIPKTNSLCVLLMESGDLHSFVHSYYTIEFKKDEYIKCTDEWHRSSSKYIPETSEEYTALDEKLHVAVDKQIADFDKEIKIKNIRKYSSIEWKENK